jgi:hypothetical protein
MVLKLQNNVTHILSNYKKQIFIIQKVGLY